MSIIHFDELQARLKKWSAVSVGGATPKSVVRFELETSDPFTLASLLTQLAEIGQAQKAALAATKRRTGPRVQLLLEHIRGDA